MIKDSSISQLISAKVLLSALIAIGAPLSATAECTCPVIPQPVDALRKAATAFIGTVQKVKKSPIKSGYNEISFTLMKRLKGFDELPGDLVYVYTPISEDECGFPFSDGQDYVVFASGNPAGLKTTRCSGTNFLDVLDENAKAMLLGR